MRQMDTFNIHAYMIRYALPYYNLVCDRTHVGTPDDVG